MPAGHERKYVGTGIRHYNVKNDLASDSIGKKKGSYDE